MSEKMQVATNVQPIANETMLKIVSALLVVYNRLFMVLYLCLKFD